MQSGSTGEVLAKGHLASSTAPSARRLGKVSRCGLHVLLLSCRNPFAYLFRRRSHSAACDLECALPLSVTTEQGIMSVEAIYSMSTRSERKSLIFAFQVGKEMQRDPGECFG